MISVIIPAHNEKKNLEKLLAHLSSSALGSCEVILALSDQTNDGSHTVVATPSVKLISCQGRGRALQMNEAASTATGDIFVFLHADVLPPKTFLEDIRKTVKEGFDAGFFSYRFDSPSFWLKINARFTGVNGIFTGGGDQCLFIKKEVFKALNGFDEAQVIMEDFEFFRRMKKSGIPYKIVKNDLLVSARKYRFNSYVRVNLTNLLLVILFNIGIPSKKLKAIHNRYIRPSI